MSPAVSCNWCSSFLYDIDNDLKLSLSLVLHVGFLKFIGAHWMKRVVPSFFSFSLYIFFFISLSDAKLAKK
jgi:hypothetical protein